MSRYARFASVVPDVYMDKELDYGIPHNLERDVRPGVQVDIPIRGHMRKGYVLRVKDQSDFPRVQPIKAVHADKGILEADLFQLALWMAKYYCCPLSQVIKVLLPSSIRNDTKAKEQLYVMRAKSREDLVEVCKEIRARAPAQGRVLECMLKVRKGILLTEVLEQAGCSRAAVEGLVAKGYLSTDIIRVDRSPLEGQNYFRTQAKTLNSEQGAALQAICSNLDANRYQTHLLYGVTGSGKTEVYLQAIDRALALGKGTIMLVPEISLTPQTVERFRSRFDKAIAILHHRLSPGERLDEWQRIARGEARIVIGARSAIFSPIPKLGLIIVDEEHEGSYKSEESPCYHARDVAVMRGHLCKGVVILGSATPSLESFYNAQQGKYQLNRLNSRADSASLPAVQIVDMKREIERAQGYTSFCQPLLDGIQKRVASGEQCILFLNRRGYHTTQFCNGCGHVMDCPHCDCALTYHLGQESLACHLCGYTISPPPRCCPKCKSQDTLKYKGVGTEQVERALHAIFPDIRTLRMDADTTRHKGAHARLLQEFRTGKADVLVGTQMIAKGLHFPQVTLVGILNCDGSLNMPDFRASESVFQLITQVAGRAGRGALAGEVVIQTFIPENDTIRLAAAQDYDAFYQDEIAVRELFHYPPFAHLAKFTFSGLNEANVAQTASTFRSYLIGLLPKGYEIHPVIPAGHDRIKDNFRFQFLVKGPSIYRLNQAVETVRSRWQIPSSVRLGVNIDPLGTFF